jgi:hypothetical protein
MNWFGRLGPSDPGADDAELAEKTAASAAEDSLRELGDNLLAAVEAVSPAEFAWQEAHYEHDSRQGRELLFLMANYEWVRATSEMVDIKRSDTIETTIKIDVDLSQITHEAFRKRTGPIWLPVAILPPYIRRDDPNAPPDADRGPREPDLFTTVTDATGKPVPMMPAADLQHQIAAAMAEIIAKMAVSYRPPEPNHEQPVATRDQRLLLSAAIYRVLRQRSDQAQQSYSDQARQSSDQARQSSEEDAGRVTPASAIDSPRLTEARTKLATIVGYFDPLISVASDRDARTRGATDDTLPAALARRAVKVLLALRESLIVVVLMDYVLAPSVLSVRVPPRGLTVSSASVFKPRTWIIRPAGRLEIAVLLATADADRQIQVNLPDGVSVDRRGDDGPDGPERPRLDMTVHTPLPLQDLSAALDQVTKAQELVQKRTWSADLVRPFMDLVRVNAAESVDILRHYEVDYRPDDLVAAACDPFPAPGKPPQKTDLLVALRAVANDRDWQSAAFLRCMGTARLAFTGRKPLLSRQVRLSVVNAQTITGRVDITEDVSQRAIPKRATVSADVTVEDRDYFATARSSASMSLILMLIVLGFLFFWQKVNPRASGPVPEVLAIVLTLFATTQADRIERPNRSTLRGRLYTIGNWLIAASVLPALTLAIALGFEARGATADYWAVGCVVAQAGLLVPMQEWRLLATSRGWLGHRRILFTDTPDYRHFEALRSDYWRDTTAEALTIGRKAHGYVVWQEADPAEPDGMTSPQLLPLLVWKDAPPTESSSVLALLRTGTLRQAVTFIVFRGEPDESWAVDEGDPPAAGDRLEREPLDLAPGRLTPATGVTRMVDLFVGIPRDEIRTVAEHPVSIAVQAAADKLTVLDAQLPVPAPVTGHADKRWARVRVALRDSTDIRRLTDFLEKLRDALHKSGNPGVVVAVQATPSAVPVVIAGPTGAPSPPPPPSDDERRPPVLTGDLDFVNGTALDHDLPGDRTWRVVVICADARSNIESDILKHVAAARKNYQLGALTYALLHGTAVMALFVHETAATEAGPDHAADDAPDREADSAPDSAAALEAKLQGHPGCDKLRVLLSQPLSREDMEPAEEHSYPMLRVHFRWQDRPGATKNVLAAIGTALREALPSIHGQDWSVSYARLQVITGQVAIARMTLRLHVPWQAVDHWTPAYMEETARKIEYLAAGAAAKQAAEAAGRAPEAAPAMLRAPEEPVVRIDRIRKV